LASQQDSWLVQRPGVRMMLPALPINWPTRKVGRAGKNPLRFTIRTVQRNPGSCLGRRGKRLWLWQPRDPSTPASGCAPAWWSYFFAQKISESETLSRSSRGCDWIFRVVRIFVRNKTHRERWIPRATASAAPSRCRPDYSAPRPAGPAGGHRGASCAAPGGQPAHRWTSPQRLSRMAISNHRPTIPRRRTRPASLSKQRPRTTRKAVPASAAATTARPSPCRNRGTRTARRREPAPPCQPRPRSNIIRWHSGQAAWPCRDPAA